MWKPTFDRTSRDTLMQFSIRVNDSRVGDMGNRRKSEYYLYSNKKKRIRWCIYHVMCTILQIED